MKNLSYRAGGLDPMTVRCDVSISDGVPGALRPLPGSLCICTQVFAGGMNVRSVFWNLGN